MVQKNHILSLYKAWIRLLAAYLIAFALSLVIGLAMMRVFEIDPMNLFAVSTKRISYVSPLLEFGSSLGINPGIFLFIWNTSGALITLSFIHTAAWLNPNDIHQFPRLIRKICCGKKPMKILCYLPGCLSIKQESLRRLYVWLMIPLPGMILLGLESGFTASAVSWMSGSFYSGIIPLLPHGIIEIPALCLAGAIPFSAHLLIKFPARSLNDQILFNRVAAYKKQIPMAAIVFLVVLFLLIAGLIEANFTMKLVESLSK